MKVLIVDDLFENRKLLQELLLGYGECDLTANGQDGLDLFVSALEEVDGGYDLVLLDIMMPGMDGHEVLHAMRSKEQELGIKKSEETVIFMVTAVRSPRHALDAFFKGGCSDYLEKPISQDILLAKIKEYDLI